MSVVVTVPNGLVPQVPLQKSDVRGKFSVAADAEVITPTETSAVVRIRDDALISCLLRTLNETYAAIAFRYSKA
jgi:hypothetical protein